jgi:hypothetical protein
MIGPNIGEDERPDSDENIDEVLDRRGRSKEPADLVVHAFRSAADFARIRASVIPPAATAAPSVFTESPIQAAATRGSCERKAWARNGRIKTSMTAKITTSEDTITGTTGRDLIALPVAIAVDTPQIDMPEAHSRLNPNHLRQCDDEATLICEPQRPANAVFLEIRRRNSGELSVAANNPARIGDPECR